MKFIDILKGDYKSQASISYAQAQAVAESVGVPKKDLDHLLSFLHNMNSLMWFSESHLRETVILDPFEFLVRAMSTVICNHSMVTEDGDNTYHETPASKKCSQRYYKEWAKFTGDAIIDRKLLVGEYSLLEEWQDKGGLIVDLMTKFSLLVPIVNIDESEDTSNSNTSDKILYLVPSMLPSRADPYKQYEFFDKNTVKSQCVFIFSVGTYFMDLPEIAQKSIADFALCPKALFTRLLGNIIAHCQETSPNNSLDILSVYQNELTAWNGNQQFRIKEFPDEKYFLLEIEGSYALAVVKRIEELIQKTLDDCMPSLKFATCLPLPSTSSFVPLERMQQTVSANAVLRFKERTTAPLSPEQMYELYDPFIIKQTSLIFDFMLSYRWGEFDTSFVAKIFDSMSRFAIGDSNRQLVGFLDDKSLKKGLNFQMAFASALINSSVVVPVLSSDTLDRMSKHDPTKDDNVLIEWILAIECLASDKSRVERVFPIFFKRDSMKFLSIDGLPQALPETVPLQSIKIAKAALAAHDPPITPRDSIDSLTVRQIVLEIYKSNGIALHKLAVSKQVVECTKQIFDVLLECKGIKEIESKSPSKLRKTVAQAASSTDTTTSDQVSKTQVAVPISSMSISSPGGAGAGTVEQSRFEKAWDILSDSKVNSQDPSALEECLKSLGVTSYEDLSYLDPDDWSAIAKNLKKAKSKQFLSLVVSSA